MAIEFNTGSDASLNEAVKSRYEANSDTNAFTDAEKGKLAGIPADSEANTVDSVNGASGAIVLTADDINDGSSTQKFVTAAQISKLNGVEDGATADQTGTEIVSAIDATLGGSGWQSGGGASGPVEAVANVEQDRILGRASTGSGNSEELTPGTVRGLLNVADGATANTGALADADTVDTAQIENNAVTLTKLAQIASSRILGRTANGTGSVQALSAAQILGMLGLQSTSVGAGAALVGFADPGNLFDAEDVDTALTELATYLDTYGDAVFLDQADIVLKGEQDVVVYDAGGDPDAVRPSQAATKTVIWFNHGSSLPANMGTFDIAVGGGFGVVSVNTQTGNSYELTLGDAGLSLDMDSASANTVTIPSDSTVAFSVGSCVAVTQIGGGVTTIAGAPGVTVNGSSNGSVDINSQYSGCVIRKIAPDTWIAQGDVS